MAGSGLKTAASPIVGAIALALHVRSVAKHYGIPVVLHSDHCSKNLLPWFEGLLEADETFHSKYGEPLFGSHTLDLSEEPDADNMAICVRYYKRMVRVQTWLEVEVGVSKSYPECGNSSAEQVFSMYDALSRVGRSFSIAPAFGNVHGVYSTMADAKIAPEQLELFQSHVQQQLFGTNTTTTTTKPLFLVMHGGSRCSDDEIQTALKNGVVKVNIDTETQVRRRRCHIERKLTKNTTVCRSQWAYWDGIRMYERKRHEYLQQKSGNPDGQSEPNKKFFNSRVWLRKAEQSMAKQVATFCEKLRCKGRCIVKEHSAIELFSGVDLPTKLHRRMTMLTPIALVAIGVFAGSTSAFIINACSKRRK